MKWHTSKGKGLERLENGLLKLSFGIMASAAYLVVGTQVKAGKRK